MSGGILHRVKSVAVVDLAGRILPSILDETGAGIVQRRLEEKGAEFYLSDSVTRFNGNARTLKAAERSSSTFLSPPWACAPTSSW